MTGPLPPHTLPPFLQLWQSVDLRRADPDPIDRLMWGITGERRAT